MSDQHIDLMLPRRDGSLQTFRAYCRDGEVSYIVSVVTRGSSVYERWVPRRHSKYSQLRGMAADALREKPLALVA